MTLLSSARVTKLMGHCLLEGQMLSTWCTLWVPLKLMIRVGQKAKKKKKKTGGTEMVANNVVTGG